MLYPLKGLIPSTALVSGIGPEPVTGCVGPERLTSDRGVTMSVRVVLTTTMTHCVHGDAGGEAGDVVAT
jgi:hypothetical protein